MADQTEPLSNHSSTARGRAFVWGGLIAGVLLMLLLFTRCFGLFRGSGSVVEQSSLVHRGDSLFVPAGSVLRERLLVAPAAEVSISGRLLAPAVIESDPARTAALLSPVAGRVQELKVGLGDRVAAGQILAVIDSSDLAQAYEDNAKAADAFALTGKNLERQEGQAKIGALSERDLDQARSDHAQAAAEYARTQTRLKVIGVSADAKSRSHLLVLRAPFGGSITAISVATGNMINDPSQAVLTLVHLGTVWVTALIAEKDIPAAAIGEEAEVRLAADPDHVLRGKVQTVSDVVDADSHRTKVRIAFDNDGYRLKPNMFASVTLLGQPRTQVVLPTSALLMNNDRTSVFVATAPWTFQRRTVKPDMQEGATVAITSGLKAGEQVVVKGGILLND